MGHPAPPARLITLGRLTLLDGAGVENSSLATRRRKLVLLAVLASTRRPHTRDALIEMFWGDQGETRARHSLSDSLSHLRRVLGPDSITLRRADVELEREEALETDAGELTAAAREGRWAHVVAVYGGPFLDAVHVGGSSRLESWIDGERDRIERLFAGACKHECERYAREGDWPACAELAKRWLDRDPQSPHSALFRIEALSAAGTDDADRHALDAYGRLERLLQAEFDCAPDERVAHAARAIAERVANRQASIRVEIAAAAAPSPDTVATPIAEPGAPPYPRPHHHAIVTPARTKAPVGRSRRRVFATAGISVATLAFIAAAVVATVNRKLPDSTPSAASDTRDAGTIGRDRNRNVVLVADFLETGVEPALAELVSAAIRIDLSRSPMMHVVRPDVVRGALERMRRAPSSTIDSATAHDLAIREALPLLVTGRIATTSDGILITADLIMSATGQRLLSVREIASDSTSMLDAIERVSRMLRLRAGEPTSSVRTSAPLSAVTTASLAALQLYTRGVRAYERDGDREEAIRLIEGAIALDSGFAMAYRRLGLIYNNDVEARDRTAQLLTLAVRHAARLPERERHLTTGTYHTLVTNDFANAARAYRALLALDPTDASAWNSLGNVYQYLGDQTRAADAYASSVRHDRTAFSAWVNLSDARYATGDVAGAWAALDSLAVVSPQHPSYFMRTAALAQSEGDRKRAERSLRQLIEASPGSARGQSVGYMLLARLLWSDGRYAEGDSARRQGIAIDSARAAQAAALEGELELALSSVWLHDDTAEASRRIANAVQRTRIDSLPLLDRPYLDLVMAYALSGSVPAARATLAKYERLLPAHAQRADRQRLASARGSIALAERRYDDAVREYTAARGPLCPVCGLPELGLALERAGKPDQALRVYRQYMTTRSLRRADATEGFHGVRVAARLRDGANRP